MEPLGQGLLFDAPHPAEVDQGQPMQKELWQTICEKDVDKILNPLIVSTLESHDAKVGIKESEFLGLLVWKIRTNRELCHFTSWLRSLMVCGLKLPGRHYRSVLRPARPEWIGRITNELGPVSILRREYRPLFPAFGG